MIDFELVNRVINIAYTSQSRLFIHRKNQSKCYDSYQEKFGQFYFRVGYSATFTGNDSVLPIQSYSVSNQSESSTRFLYFRERTTDVYEKRNILYNSFRRHTRNGLSEVFEFQIVFKCRLGLIVMGLHSSDIIMYMSWSPR